MINIIDIAWAGSIKQYTRSNDGREYHYWTLNGANARGFLLSIFVFLSPRRKAQILKYPLFFKDSNFLPSNFCLNGHEYTPENVFIEKGHGREWKTCKICRKNHYDRKNEKRRNETPDEKFDKMLTKYKEAVKKDGETIQ